jgi:hypothetical protein
MTFGSCRERRAGSFHRPLCRGDRRGNKGRPNLAEIIIPHQLSDQRCSAELVDRKVRPALLLVVWALKREVRAIRGCLGAYRR